MDSIEKHSSSSSVVGRIFIAAGTCLPSRFPVTIGGKHIQTHRLMDSDDMIYMPSLIKIGPVIQTLIGGGDNNMEIA
jgi:hypothetical protein